MAYGFDMARFTVQLCSHDLPITIDCDGYAQEGTMLTFFMFGSDSATIDVWSRRIASYRTSDVVSVVRDPSEEIREIPVLVAC
ncbi:MAG: hypothetical protein KJN63_01855 [Acidimicrobiia bacterium]|nr:hypothetical protein [Acidimicrobiia bacterium]